MSVRTAGLAAILAAAAFAAVPAQGQTRCAVTDPTGTLLNIRATPNGEIVGRVDNGVRVAIVDNGMDGRGRPWVLVRLAGTDRAVGWVFREFVSCY